MLRPTLVTPAAAATVVTLPIAKAHCRIDHPDDDALITALIAAAEAHLDGYSGILGRALLEQTWEQKFWNFYECNRNGGAFPCVYKLRLPVGIASSIVSIHYYDSDNVDQTVGSAVYQLMTDELGSYVSLKPLQTWPATYYREDAVTIQWKAGYGATAALVPAAIRHAMLLLVGHWYENRESVVIGETAIELPMAVKALLAPHSRVGF